MYHARRADLALDFEEYVRIRQDGLLRIARRLVDDPLDAQDLLQTALTRTYLRWERIADKRLADAYLRRVMINTRTEWWRARRLTEVPTGQLPDTGVADCAEQHADRAELLDAMKVLAPLQRSVVLLRHWEQMSTEETASALGIAPGTVKSALHRAIAQLRKELQHRAPGSASTPVACSVNQPACHRARGRAGAHLIPGANGQRASGFPTTVVQRAG